MESGNTAANLKLLGWRTLEERRIDNKLGTLKKGFLGKIDIPTDRFNLNSTHAINIWTPPMQMKQKKIDNKQHNKKKHTGSKYNWSVLKLKQYSLLKQSRKTNINKMK